jgi:hypothetical protein
MNELTNKERKELEHLRRKINNYQKRKKSTEKLDLVEEIAV